MAQATSSVLFQLDQARNIVLTTPSVYPQVVPGVLGVIGGAAALELRRWGADFLAETFASPVLPAEEKQKLSLPALDTLRAYLNRKEERGEDEDGQVIKSAVQCAASLYPLVFRHTVAEKGGDAESWAKMAAIKSAILRRMDSASAGVRICCVKFVARVVQVQTPGLISDPRRPEQNEISLALVPRDHPVIPPSNLEAEASGLLDRLLGVLQDNLTDALVVTATLNSLATLVHRRASVSNKVLTTILNFNPLALAGTGRMEGKDRVAIRSMARTTIAFLLNVLKRNPQHPFAGRLQQRTEQLRHYLNEVFIEGREGKRKVPDEPTDGLDDSKRRRIDTEAANGATPVQQHPYQQQPPQQQQQSQLSLQQSYPPLPPGPVTVAQLFTLSQDPNAAGFHVASIPQQIVSQLVPPLLQSIDPQRFEGAINAVRSRFLNLATSQQPPSALEAARAANGDDEEDDYDPSSPATFPGAQEAQVLNQLDQMAPEGEDEALAIGPFVLPPPPPLSEEERREYEVVAQERIFSQLAKLDATKSNRSAAMGNLVPGLVRVLSVGGQDREGWVGLITRLATRTTFGLGDEQEEGEVQGGEDGMVKSEEDGMGQRDEEDEERSMKAATGKEGKDLKKSNQSPSPFHLADRIRTALRDYVTSGFRQRIDVGIAWLNEEWYADRLALSHRQSKHNNTSTSDENTTTTTTTQSSPPPLHHLPNYLHHSLALLDALTPYLDVKDGRFLIRFLSELPQLGVPHLTRISKLADDPDRVAMAVQAFLYLVMFRPPVRGICLDAVEELWRANGDAKTGCERILGKWRPGVLKREGGG
ncbi:hypothetical protein KC340_g1979 [Hortaea werneckii]|nr:hypothetical protein KC342_g5063 [Hortaea werneckii]KAI7105558.1 hypothetical protein KC339_g3742 [Hortaea werneckii]KAI7335794.1 hypothetical protein KC340_g1979 [Hortaea werneckii]KAI7384518.1 hypothetical protein KC328_g10768 [Hortaea werneckii]KAI7475683.1 hypothetical protein KC351_g9932 [Hortaea werneckii]